MPLREPDGRRQNIQSWYYKYASRTVGNHIYKIKHIYNNILSNRKY